MTAASGTGRIDGRLLLRPLAGGCGLAMIGYWPTRMSAGGEGAAAMLSAVALVLAVVYATLLPAMWRMGKAEARRRFQIALGAGVVRFLATAAATGLIVWRGLDSPAVFLIWVAIAYVLLIGVETWTLISWTKRLEIRP